MNQRTVVGLDASRIQVEEIREKVTKKLDELLHIINMEAAPIGLEVNFNLGPSGYGKRMQITSLRIMKELSKPRRSIQTNFGRRRRQ